MKLTFLHFDIQAVLQKLLKDTAHMGLVFGRGSREYENVVQIHKSNMTEEVS